MKRLNILNIHTQLRYGVVELYLNLLCHMIQFSLHSACAVGWRKINLHRHNGNKISS